jgi:hypothetical protein
MSIIDCNPITNGNVILIDPNCININTNLYYGIPKYEDMYIFAELTAESKGRTTIIKGQDTSSTSPKKINFLGNNQDDDKNNPNYLNFTTNYYDGSTGNGMNYEGFGIDNIKITINSSFVPQIDIKFVDIRGLSFFNEKDSPYRMLFDFPPPIFTLTFKGYYGKPLTYKLHLVKYTSEFNSNNGNFIIDAKFVALTFAPLADILFRYAINFPLITNPESVDAKAGTEPQNTYALILKLKNLYSSLSEKLETDIENKEYQHAVNDIDNINQILYNFNHTAIKENDDLNSVNTPYLLIQSPESNTSTTTTATRAGENNQIKITNNVNEYKKLISDEKTGGLKTTINDKLLLGFISSTNIALTSEDYVFPDYMNKILPVANPYQYSTKNLSSFEITLNSFRDKLLNYKISSIEFKQEDIIKATSILNGYNVETNENVETEYYVVDISKYYQKLYKKKHELEENKIKLANNLNNKINNMITTGLGMKPTIYNIFKIILNDVDDLFTIMRNTSEKAFNSHNISENKQAIIGYNNGVDGNISANGIPDKIYSFPLIIEDSPVFGGRKNERVAPIELSKVVEFPEMNLIYDFIDTFQLQKNNLFRFNARENQNDDGTYEWIPISPYDSSLSNISPETPYTNMSDNVVDDIFKTFIKRFYMLSQGFLSTNFYSNENEKSKAYLELYSKSEALNIVKGIVKKRDGDMLIDFSNKYKNNIQSFYDNYLNKLTDGDAGNLYNFNNDNPLSFSLTPTEGNIYVNKNDINFKGVLLTDKNIDLQPVEDSDSNSQDIVKKFRYDATRNWYKTIFGRGKSAEELIYQFTNENVLYLRDHNSDDGYDDNINGIITNTRYLVGDYSTHTSTNNGVSITRYNSNFPKKSADEYVYNYGETIMIPYYSGNSAFTTNNSRDRSLLKQGKNILDVWMDSLNDETIEKINENRHMGSLLILSNFGTTASPFNTYPNNLSSLVFDTPSAIEVPFFYISYIGLLVDAVRNNWENDIIDFCTGSTAANLSNGGYYILADLHDVNHFLSVKDKDFFQNYYSEFINGDYDDLASDINHVYEQAKNYSIGSTRMFQNISVGIRYYLDPNTGSNDTLVNDNAIGKGSRSNIITSLMERTTLLNLSDITFKTNDTYPINYISLKTQNDNNQKKNINDNFFQKFFIALDSYCKIYLKDLKEKDEAAKKSKGDKDVINQLYYSFKNINDKWLTGGNLNPTGFPFNGQGKKLIDMFAFVDRGMNPIGDTMINAEMLVDLYEDPNVSLYSVLSQLLSANGFEFFPLQNFLKFNDVNSWMDTFKIHTGGYDDAQNTYFVCMYVGGTSSYPSIHGNGFEPDSIIDMGTMSIGDFNTTKPTEAQDTENDTQENNLSDFPWRQVRAFRVKFGEQNQSMFTDIKIDSKEYPETNESIQILSRLAGDNNPTAQVPKGQNLYNLYENRSYKASITGLGNAMIQPTQYFQLENIPMFNGAYIILTVEHNITANKMTTTFSGTKLLQYPIPRVTSPLAFTGLDIDLSLIENNQTTPLSISNDNNVNHSAMYNNTSNSLRIG